MKILLIDPPGWQKHSVNLGLAYLAGALASENIEVQILDLNNHPCSGDTLKKIIEEMSPAVIGISIKTATANTSAKIVRNLKKTFPHIMFVAGGPHISLCAENFLNENRSFDFGIVGDGEVSFTALVKSLMKKEKDFSRVRGLCYYRDNILTLNTSGVGSEPEIARLAYPKFEALMVMDFQDFRYPLLTSRGCPYGCIFCCVGAISGKKWRPRNPEDIVKELVDAKDKYQITSFEIMDDNFTFDVARAKEVSRLLIKKGLRLDWWCHNGVRADKLDPELLRLMKKAGCQSIAIGIETGDENVFRGINKGETLEDITRAVKMIKRAGMQCVGYFIVGLPGDSIASTKKTVRFQRSLKLSNHTYNIAIPYPGTKMAKWVQDNGRLLLDIKETYHFGENAKIPFETDQLDQETIRKCFQLANHQGWVWGERDLHKIRDFFKTRYQRDIQRVIVIVDRDVEGLSKNIHVEYGQAKIVEIQKDESFRGLDSRQSLELCDTHDYFDKIFDITQEGAEIIVDIPFQKLFIQDKTKAKEEYIKDEALSDPSEWDKPEGKYYATRLKHFSPATCVPQNGIIYKDGIALPFNSAPQWEKVACGKIESGLAFISLAAYDTASKYTADYLSTNLGAFTKELVLEKPIPQGEEPFFLWDTLLTQADILFIPESLAGYAYVAARTKMNVVYQKRNDEPLALKYELLTSFVTASGSLQRTINLFFFHRMALITQKTRQLLFYAKVAVKGVALWGQILGLMFWGSTKNSLNRIIRISR